VPTSPKICGSTTLGNLKCEIEPSTQYLHVDINEALNNTKTTCSYCLKIIKRVVGMGGATIGAGGQYPPPYKGKGDKGVQASNKKYII